MFRIEHLQVGYYYVLDRGAIAAEGSAADLSEDQVKQHLTV
jgi:urea transport system ATP-binding protein